MAGLGVPRQPRAMDASKLGRDMKKHSNQEILSKLVRADELARTGVSQLEACKELGVSVMTLHRWRKLSLSNDSVPPSQRSVAVETRPTASPGIDDMRLALDELTLENQRLRRIVTDLLLQKTALEEASVATSGTVSRARPAAGPDDPSAVK